MSFGRSGSKLAAASAASPWPAPAIMRRPPWPCGFGRHGLCFSRIDKLAEADRDAVPAVDDVDHQGELDLLFLGELSLQGFAGAFQLVAFGEPRQGLGPAERGAFAVGVARSLAPGREQIDALLGLALLTRFRRMHIEAVGAAIDLGGPDFHEPDQGRFKARSDGERCGGPLLHQFGGRGKEFVGGHGSVPSVGSDIMTSEKPPV